jgi:hypothetical protein
MLKKLRKTRDKRQGTRDELSYPLSPVSCLLSNFTEATNG